MKTPPGGLSVTTEEHRYVAMYRPSRWRSLLKHQNFGCFVEKGTERRLGGVRKGALREAVCRLEILTAKWRFTAKVGNSLPLHFHCLFRSPSLAKYSAFKLSSIRLKRNEGTIHSKWLVLTPYEVYILAFFSQLFMQYVRLSVYLSHFMATLVSFKQRGGKWWRRRIFGEFNGRVPRLPSFSAGFSGFLI